MMSGQICTLAIFLSNFTLTLPYFWLRNSSSSVGSFTLKKRMKRNYEDNYLPHPQEASGHEDVCQAQGQSVKRPGYGEEGEGQCSSEL